MKAVVATLVAFALVAIGALSATAAPRPTPSPARLVVTGVATPAAGVTVGATVDYTYSIWNTGGQAVIVTFGDALPSQVLPIEADPTQGSCSTDQQVICWLGSVGGRADGDGHDRHAGGRGRRLREQRADHSVQIPASPPRLSARSRSTPTAPRP